MQKVKSGGGLYKGARRAKFVPLGKDQRSGVKGSKWGPQSMAKQGHAQLMGLGSPSVGCSYQDAAMCYTRAQTTILCSVCSQAACHAQAQSCCALRADMSCLVAHSLPTTRRRSLAVHCAQACRALCMQVGRCARVGEPAQVRRLQTQLSALLIFCYFHLKMLFWK